MKKIVKVIVIMFASFLLFGCENGKTFDEGNFKITLGSEFKKDEVIVYEYAYSSYTTRVLVNKDSFDDLSIHNLDENSTLEEYAEVIKKANSYHTNTFTKRNDYIYYSYTDGDYFYIAAVKKGKDAFWIVNFVCEKDKSSIYKEDFLKYSDSIEV